MAGLPDEVYSWIASHLHPSPTDSWEPIYKTTIGDGDIQIFNLTEACYDVDAAFPFLPEDHEKLPLSESGRLSTMRFGLCLVQLPNSVNVLLDAGLGPFLDDVQKCSGHPVPEKPPHALNAILETLGLSMDQIHYVVHSHAHGDHVGWVGSFPNAIHFLHSREYVFASYSGCPWKQDAMARFEPLLEQGRLIFLEGEDDIILDAEHCPQVSAFLCPGHTPGHIGVRIHDAVSNQNAIYIGDTMHFACQVEHPDIIPIFDCCAWKSRPFLPMGDVEKTWLPVMRSNPKTWNTKTSSKARRALLQKIVDQKALLLSPHFAPPGMGTIIQHAPGDDDNEFTYVPKILG